MAIKIHIASKLAQQGGVKLAVHSGAGMGKTLLAATLKKCVIIQTERKLASCLSDVNCKKVYGKKIPKIGVVEAFSYDNFIEALDELTDDERFDTIMIDSVSELSKLILKMLLPNHNNKMQAYGELAEMLDDLLRKLQESDKNIIYNFHSGVQEVYDDEGDPSGSVFIPAVEGQKMKFDIRHLIGDVFCIVNDFDDETGEEARFLRTKQGDTPYYAKNCSGVFKELEPMNLQAIIDKLSGE